MKGRLCLGAISKWIRCNKNYGYGHRVNPVYAVVKTLLDEGTSVDECKTSFVRCAVRLFSLQPDHLNDCDDCELPLFCRAGVVLAQENRTAQTSDLRRWCVPNPHRRIA